MPVNGFDDYSAEEGDTGGEGEDIDWEHEGEGYDDEEEDGPPSPSRRTKPRPGLGLGPTIEISKQWEKMKRMSSGARDRFRFSLKP